MSTFKLSFEPLDLQLQQPFTIARGTKKQVHNVLVRISDGTVTGYGEAAPNSRYDEDAESVMAFLNRLPVNFLDNVTGPGTIPGRLAPLSPPVQSAKAAVEMAWLDWWGKQNGTPLWKLWEAPSATGPVTSYTIGLDTVEVMQQKVRQAPDYPVYKVKLGTGNDRAIIRGLRQVTDTPIRVDANEGWTTLDEAKEMITFLADQNIELVEQPLPAAHNTPDMKRLKTWSPLPLCADESFMGDESMDDIADAFDIINIKLMKIGGLLKARRVIAAARTHGLQVMIGCMIESSIANTAGGLLSLWADYADLDGHLLIADDPAAGLQLDPQKRVVMPDTPGLGVQLKE